MSSGDNKNHADILSNISNFCDQNLRSIKYVSYGLGLVGVIIIGRSIHVTKQFSVVRDIPEDFIKKGVKLNTVVNRCDAQGIVWVRHIPVLSLKKISDKNTELLPLKLLGVDHTFESVQWLKEKITTDKTVWCDVHKINVDKQLDTELYYQMKWLRKTSINEYLIQQGLARLLVDFNKPENYKDQEHKRTDQLVEKLTKAELYAEKKGKGLWKRPSIKERVFAYPGHIQSKIKEILRSKN